MGKAWWTAAGGSIIAMLLALAPHMAAAQSAPGFGSNPFDRDDAPALAMNFGGGPVRSFEREMQACLLYTSPSPRDRQKSRMPSSA